MWHAWLIVQMCLSSKARTWPKFVRCRKWWPISVRHRTHWKGSTCSCKRSDSQLRETNCCWFFIFFDVAAWIRRRERLTIFTTIQHTSHTYMSVSSTESRLELDICITKSRKYKHQISPWWWPHFQLSQNVETSFQLECTPSLQTCSCKRWTSPFKYRSSLVK